MVDPSSTTKLCMNKYLTLKISKYLLIMGLSAKSMLASLFSYIANYVSNAENEQPFVIVIYLNCIHSAAIHQHASAETYSQTQC